MTAFALLLPFKGIAAPALPDYPEAIGPGEGALGIIAWEGYLQDEWVRPFEAATGCKITRKYAGSSDEMVDLMRGNDGAYDLVTASGDASLRLIYGGDVEPIAVGLIADFASFLPALQSPSFNTLKGVHYGLSYQWGPNVLLWSTPNLTVEAASWASIYSRAFSGKISVPNNPIQIADAALYLSKTRPDLAIDDPYELTPSQLDAAIGLLKEQKPFVSGYWSSAADQIAAFQKGESVVGAGWPYMAIALRKAGTPVRDAVPSEGATGWADSWMLSVKGRHRNCAYKYMSYASTPDVQAQQALAFGETPVNGRACAEMNRQQAGSCERYHLDAPVEYLRGIKFWKTPMQQCSKGLKACTSYVDWQRKWDTIVK